MLLFHLGSNIFKRDFILSETLQNKKLGNLRRLDITSPKQIA